MHFEDQRSRNSSFIPLTINRQIVQSDNFRPFLEKYHDQSLIVRKIEPWWTQLFNYLDKKIPIIKPQSVLIVFWDFLLIISIIFNLYEIPIIIFFTEAAHKTEFTTWWSVLINWLFFFIIFGDMIIVRPNLAIQRKGYLLLNHQSIILHYLKPQFWFDLASCIVLFLYLVAYSYDLVYVKLIFYLRLYDLMILHNFLLSRLGLMRLRLAFYRLIMLILIIMIVVTWVAGIYFIIDYNYYLQQNQYYPKYLWLTYSQCTGYGLDLIQTYQWWVWLDYAYYWALQTMSTLGYGDMTPRNPPQVVYCNIVILLTLFMFATFVNSVWQIIADATQLQSKEAANLRVYKQFRKQNKISADMNQKMLAYLHQKWQYDQDDEIDGIIDQILPQELKNQLYLNYRSSIFKDLNFMNEDCVDLQNRDDCMLQMIQLIKQKRYAQNQTIYKTGDTDNQLFYILTGSVRLYYPPSKYQQKINETGTFGKIDFISGSARQQNASSYGFSKLAMISKDNFLKIIKKYFILYQTYIQFLEQIQFYGNVFLINQYCWNCKKNHRFTQCDKLFIVTHEVRNRLRPSNIQHKTILSTDKCSRLSFVRHKTQSKKITSSQSYIRHYQIDNVHRFAHYKKDFNFEKNI